MVIPFVSNLSKTTVSYDDVAKVVVDNLNNESFSDCRVGLGLHSSARDGKGLATEIANRLLKLTKS